MIPPVNSIDKQHLLSTELLKEVFDEADELKRAEILATLGLRASDLHCKTEFREMVATFKKVAREIERKREIRKQCEFPDGWTNFDNCPYMQMHCGGWIATDNGITMVNSDTGVTDRLACYHPILPIERLKNLETGEEQIKLAYKRNGMWEEIIVPKTLIASASKIVALSGRGIAVTSESAKYLVRYLADLENLNEDVINIQYSSSKLGWIRNTFLPYDDKYIFDGDARFRQLSTSIQTEGNREEWFRHAKMLRKTGRIEVKMMLAASFASILVQGLGALPFIVDLWGETEGGKTVVLMLACSVWANPAENAYIGDFKTTDVALEAKADLLNNLPMFLDDTSRTSARIRENFEGIVYDLCSGKGKSRSNKELGINRENRWCNCFLTNGERPLASYVTQGGAINRILEIECSDHIFPDPHQTAELVRKNYGFAGKEFVEIIKKMDKDYVRDIQTDFQKQILQTGEKMQKQAMALSIVLTADKIVTDELFKDGEYITLAEAEETLASREIVSDNERCYRYLVDKIHMNPQRFDSDTKCEKWGLLDSDIAYLISEAFEELCKAGDFSPKSFLSWGVKRGLVVPDKEGNQKKQKKIAGVNGRRVWLRLNGADSQIPPTQVDSDGFTPLADIEGEDFSQFNLPFGNNANN